MKITDIEPHLDRLILERVETERKERGIFIPDTAKLKTCLGRVLTVGPGRLDDDGKHVPIQYKQGDLVLIGRYAGQEVDIMGEYGYKETYITMTEDEVLGKVKNVDKKAKLRRMREDRHASR